MEKKWFLLIKKHNETGLKYLCRHVTAYKNSCYTYLGSGVHWTRHLNKHGSDISTEILEECDTEEQSKERGLYWSKLFDVVKSKEWANLIPENGQGGAEPVKYRKTHTGWRGLKMVGNANPSKRPEVREKISKALKGRKLNKAWRKKLSAARSGKEPWNKGKPGVPNNAGLSAMNKEVVCPHCKKVGGLGAMKRWHFGQCKQRT